MKDHKYIPVLTIAGSDSGGGAGIQADLKTFAALGCFGTSAITAITVQNTMGVTGIHSVPVEIVRGQIHAVIDDINPLAIKIGMVHSTELALEIAAALKQYPHIPVILDPVMVASSGDKLIQDDTVEVMKEVLFPLALIVTPNIDEAEILTGIKIADVPDMERVASILLGTGCKAVLVKGGHLVSDQMCNVLLDADGNKKITVSDFIKTNNIHGTGCTLSAAIAANIAKGKTLQESVYTAVEYVALAIQHGQYVKTGNGNGPLNHFYNPEKLIIR